MEAPEKVYIPTILAANVAKYKTEGSIEYIRTDAFIKKASFWLECNLSDRPIEDRKFWVEDFINYMVGE